MTPAKHITKTLARCYDGVKTKFKGEVRRRKKQEHKPNFQDATPPSPDTDTQPLNTYVPLAHR